MAEVTHDGEVVSGFLSGKHRAHCSCGWESRSDHDDREKAWDDWSNHTDQVFMEATGG